VAYDNAVYTAGAVRFIELSESICFKLAVQQCFFSVVVRVYSTKSTESSSVAAKFEN